MPENLKYYLKINTDIDQTKINKMVKMFKVVTVKKNTTILSKGQVCRDFYFVNSGCIRTYYVTEEGQEKTRFVAFENSVATSIPSFISQQPTFEIIDALEDSELYSISHSIFYQWTQEVPAWGAFYTLLLEMAYVFQNKKIQDLVTLSAKQRYDRLMNETPYYFLRLSNKVLASYLDMTPETLSRLKSK